MTEKRERQCGPFFCMEMQRHEVSQLSDRLNNIFESRPATTVRFTATKTSPILITWAALSGSHHIIQRPKTGWRLTYCDSVLCARFPLPMSTGGDEAFRRARLWIVRIPKGNVLDHAPDDLTHVDSTIVSDTMREGPTAPCLDRNGSSMLDDEIKQTKQTLPILLQCWWIWNTSAHSKTLQALSVVDVSCNDSQRIARFAQSSRIQWRRTPHFRYIFMDLKPFNG